MDKYAETLSKNVATLLKESNLSRTAFSEKVGITRAQLNNLLKGEPGNPTLELLDRISASYGKDALWLLTDHEAESAPSAEDLAKVAAREAVTAFQAEQLSGARGEILRLIAAWDDEKLGTVLRYVRTLAGQPIPASELPHKGKKSR